MNRNHHQGAGPVRNNHIALMVVGIGVFAMWGLGLVSATNTMHALAKQRKDLENRLRILQEDNATLRTEIASQSSPRVLEQKMRAGFICLVPITGDRIVRLNTGTLTPGGNGLRAVSNQIGSP